MMADATATTLLAELWAALGGSAEMRARVDVVGEGSLSSVFAVSDLAVAAVASAGLAAAELVATLGGEVPSVTADRRLASFWFGFSVRPQGWTIPPAWDSIAGDYPARDGWIRLHTNAPAHRAAALAVLGVAPERDAVAAAVAGWDALALESDVVAHGGCAAAMMSGAEWTAHPQGAAVAGEPLFHLDTHLPASGVPSRAWRPERDRPLHGIRVLDMTRVLAGPVATRFLAGLGATVLRVDPPDWDEPSLVADVTLGKSCTRLDLRRPSDKDRFTSLLEGADILVHGLRRDALPGLGFDAARRRAARPDLVDVSLDAYGWTGPWSGRRGFDSLVQMSSGIAEAGMRRLGRDKPTPLPVQALDHATGYLLAAAALRGLSERVRSGAGLQARTSLARVAAALLAHPADPEAALPAPESDADLAPGREDTGWGPARRLRSPIEIAGAPMRWTRPAGPLGSAEAAWPPSAG